MSTLCIIPARGGSKRIPRKNIRAFLGSPIIRYPIQAATQSGVFSEIMVSTDDQEIATVAQAYGAIVPFYRSPAGASDYATTAEVVSEVLRAYEKCGKVFKFFCCLYPTAPFVTADRLCEAMDRLQETGADAVVPVIRFAYPIQRALAVVNGRLQMIHPENMNIRSQDLAPSYHDAGLFYVMKTESFLRQETLFADFTVPLILSEVEAQDIDTEDDWMIAEMKYRVLRERSEHSTQ